MSEVLVCKTIAEKYISRFPHEASRFLENKSEEFSVKIFDQLGINEQATLIKCLNPDLSGFLIGACHPDLDEISKYVDPSIICRILQRLSPQSQTDILNKVSESLRRELQQLMSYPEGTAGALMDATIISFNQSSLVKDIFIYLRKFKKVKLTDIYVYDDKLLLKGKISLQKLLSSEENQLLSEIMDESPFFVKDMSLREEIVELAEQKKLSSIPVTNAEGGLIGVIRYADLISLVHEEAIEGMQKMVGVSSDENALSPPFTAVKRRLPWLSVNLLTTFIAAAVVALFEDTIARISALAVLLPVVAGQSGNTGAQALAITMRGLALREIRLRHKWKILGKEAMVGLSNGVLIGILCVVAVYIWSGSLALAGVIGFSIVLAMISASLSGAAIPLILNSIGLDPAASSSIILTTITDIVGFISFLGLATIFSSYLI